MSDYPFYDGIPPHQRHSDTSREAAAAKLSTAKTERAKVYRFIRGCADSGATDEEIQECLAMSANTERPRRRELQLAKLVEDSGETRPTQARRKAVVWVASNLEPQGALF